MKKLTILIIVATSIVSYVIFSNLPCRNAIRIVINNSSKNMVIKRSDVKAISLEKMPYSTAKNKQFEIVIDVDGGASKKLYEFTRDNIGETASLYFCNHLFSDDIAVAAAVEDIRLTALNIDADKILALFRRVSKNVQYKNLVFRGHNTYNS